MRFLKSTHSQICSTAAGKTSPLRNEPSSVAATIASILRQADRMSFRNDGSCRIDDAIVFKNSVRTHASVRAS